MKYLLLITIIFSHLVFANNKTIEELNLNKEPARSLQNRADEGDREAQYDLGVLYHYGFVEIEASKNIQLAVYWFELAAIQGHSGAQYRLAGLYNTEPLKNPILSLEYYKLAAAQGHKKSQKILKILHDKNKKSKILQPLDLSQEPILLLQNRTEHEGNREDQYTLGILYNHDGSIIKGVSKDSTLASHYLKLAAAQGHREAQYKFAMSLDGIGVERNPKLAEKYFKLAAEQGHEEAQYQLGKMYFNGIRSFSMNSVPINLEQAIKYFKLAAMQGHRKAQYMFAYIHHYKTKEAINFKLVEEYYRLSAKQGHMFAQYELGILYLDKLAGMSEDHKTAIDWLKQAAEQGHEKAQKKIDNLNQEQKPLSWVMSKVTIWVEKQESKILQKKIEKNFAKEDLDLIAEEFSVKCENNFRS